MTTLRFLIAAAAWFGLGLFLADAVGAYLNGVLDMIVYYKKKGCPHSEPDLLKSSIRAVVNIINLGLELEYASDRIVTYSLVLVMAPSGLPTGRDTDCKRLVCGSSTGRKRPVSGSQCDRYRDLRDPARIPNCPTGILFGPLAAFD
ncbi:hypothetical protein BDR26DRAFT_959584 [Obelidium mucronatum]|nr:hypothetical protein BDR26DRAFT_959584 [Obelidium mucronatum]